MTRRLTHEEATDVVRRVNYEPLEPYPGSGRRPWRVRCLGCGEERSIKYDNAKQGHGCRRCSGSQKLTDADAVPIMRAAGIEPLAPYPGGHRAWPSKCLRCGSEVSPSLESIKRGQGGCVYCSKRVVRPEEALKVMRAAGFEPLSAYSGQSRQLWLSRCLNCGRESTPSYNSVQAKQTRCKYCQGIAVVPAEAEALMKGHRMEPLAPYPGATTPWPCRCNECDRTITPTYADVRTKNVGCPYCAERGFNLIAPGIVYLMVHHALLALKIGVSTTSAKNDRIGDHSRSGWELVRRWDVSTGEVALKVESKILDWWRKDLALPEAAHPNSMPQRGYTETVSLHWVETDEVVRRVEAEVGRLEPDHKPE